MEERSVISFVRLFSARMFLDYTESLTENSMGREYQTSWIPSTTSETQQAEGVSAVQYV